MTLQQLRAVLVLIDHQLSVSRSAERLHTTQPAVSKLIRSLETEIGVDLFVRRGNRLVGLTDAGQEAVLLARRVLADANALGNLASVVQKDAGTLRVGTTHIHARYALLDVVRRFNEAFPRVDLQLRQGAPGEIMRWINENAVDIGISSLPQSKPQGIVSVDAYPIERCLIVSRGHPLTKLAHITIADIASYPQITYDASFSSGWMVQEEFRRAGLTPRVIVRATDANVIKAYVAAGLGVAVLQKMAFEPKRDVELEAIDVGAMFPPSRAVVSLRADQYLRGYMREFVQMVAPHWKEGQFMEA